MSIINPKEAEILHLTLIEEYNKTQNMKTFFLALRMCTLYKGGYTWLSKKTKIPKSTIYYALSNSGSTKYETIMAIVFALEMKVLLKI